MVVTANTKKAGTALGVLSVGAASVAAAAAEFTTAGPAVMPVKKGE